MRRRAFLPVLAIIALLAAGLGLWAAAPAFAAPKPIGLSDNGVTFSDNLPASLFAGVLIVPGKTATRTFWVKNRETSAGNLAIALQGVTGIDPALITALSVKAVAGPTAGPVVAFPAANPCHSLVSAVGLAAGAIVQVDVTITLSSSLHAQTSQGSLGAFDLGVTLTSIDVPAPTGCAAVTPPTGGGGGGSGGGGGGGHTTTPPGELDTAIVSGSAGGSLPTGNGPDDACETGDEVQLAAATEKPLPGQAGQDCEGVAAAVVQPNTGRFFQEWDVVAWLVALVLGGIFAAWRRSRDMEEGYA